MSDYDDITWHDYKEMYLAVLKLMIHPIATCARIVNSLRGRDLPAGTSLETKLGNFVLRLGALLFAIFLYGFMLFAGPLMIALLIYGAVTWLLRH